MDWLLVVTLFGVCGLLIVRLDRVQTRVAAGAASVIDGDTVMLAAERVRLRGIDAFERDQRCNRGGTRYSCGREAHAALAGLVARRGISCAGRTYDRYGRLLAVCTADETDLNGAMVEAGWAVAYGDYEVEERRARAARRGAWAGTFDQPADWRAARGGLVEPRQDPLQLLFDIIRQMFWNAASAIDPKGGLREAL